MSTNPVSAVLNALSSIPKESKEVYINSIKDRINNGSSLNPILDKFTIGVYYAGIDIHLADEWFIQVSRDLFALPNHEYIKHENIMMNGVSSYNMGISRMELNNPECVRFFNMAITCGIQQAKNQLGLYYKNIGDMVNAEKYFKLGCDANIPQSYNNLIALYRDLGRYKDEVSIMERQIKNEPDNVMLIANMTLRMLNNGDHIGYVKSSLRIKPNNVRIGPSVTRCNDGVLELHRNYVEHLSKYLPRTLCECISCHANTGCATLQCRHTMCPECIVDTLSKSAMCSCGVEMGV
jgi:tetratricopeptide (TPR) repeat protein